MQNITIVCKIDNFDVLAKNNHEPNGLAAIQLQKEQLILC
jgi:hypothetical protein